MILAALTGTWGHAHVPSVDRRRCPRHDRGGDAARVPIARRYATLWFVTPYFAASLLLSFVAIVVYRRAPSVRVRPLPPYPQPEAEHRTESGHAIELIAELHEDLPTLEHRQDCRPGGLNQAAQARVRRVPTGHENDLWRWSMLLQEFDEVSVLGHDDDVGMACGRENLMVRRALEIQITNRQAFDGGRGTHPPASAGGS